MSRGETQYITKEVNITEKRAPTDESVKLLNEMSDKAIKNIIQQVSTSNNTLQMFSMSYRDWRTGELVISCKMTLNHKDYIFDVKVLDFEFKSEYDFIDSIYNSVCKELTNIIIQPLLSELNKTFNRGYI
jgi:hypothetical protein